MLFENVENNVKGRSMDNKSIYDAYVNDIFINEKKGLERSWM